MGERNSATDAAASGGPDAVASEQPPGASPSVVDAAVRGGGSDAGAEAGSAPRPGASPRAFRPIDDEIRELERRRMIEALAATGGVQNRAAELIHMPLRTFVTKLKRYAIAPSEWSCAR